MAAAFAIGLNKLMQFDPGNADLLLGIAAAGYAGADFLEAFASKLVARSAGAAQTGRPAPVPAAAPQPEPAIREGGINLFAATHLATSDTHYAKGSLPHDDQILFAIENEISGTLPP